MNLANWSLGYANRKVLLPKLALKEQEILQKQKVNREQNGQLERLLESVRKETNLPAYTKYFLAKL
jgi:hypothetical protein